LFLAENTYWQKEGICYKDHKVDDFYLLDWKYKFSDRSEKFYPVNYVSYYTATAYAKWLSEKIGKTVRLPYIHELEQAGRADRVGDWIDDEIRKMRVNYNNILGSSSDATLSIPNPYGVADILGNLSEICMGYQKIDRDERLNVLTYGGGFQSTKELLTSREGLRLNECRRDVGFRVVMTRNDSSYEGSCTRLA
jgi:formylglycine-generating enzyme required for sulfatase activity